jgi:hypothetical protein
MAAVVRKRGDINSSKGKPATDRYGTGQRTQPMGIRCKECHMKPLFILPWAAAGLLLAAGAASGQSSGMGVQPSGRAALEQNANESAQDITDMPYSEIPGKASSRALTNVSYGGAPDVRSEAGSPDSSPCTAGPQCNVFRGR